MYSYLVFVNSNNQIKLVADKFSFAAFFFCNLWTLYHRLFGLFFVVATLQIICSYLAAKFHPFFYFAAPSLLGFFATDIMAMKMQLEGYSFQGVVRSVNQEVAMQRLHQSI